MRTVYVDSSAALKRVFREPESAALRAVLAPLDDAEDLLVASSLAWVEVWRALRRAAIADVEALGTAALSGIAEHRLDDATLRRARSVGGDMLRSLDAIHLAAAVAVGADEIITYDARLAGAAAQAGVRTRSPH